MPHPAMSPHHVAVITGGASGIGLAAALRFAGLGMRVCIADIREDRLVEAAARLALAAKGGAADVMAEAVDVSRFEEVAKLAAERGWTCFKEERGAHAVLVAPAGTNDQEKIRKFVPRYVRFFQLGAPRDKVLDKDKVLFKENTKVILGDLRKTVGEVKPILTDKINYINLGKIASKPYVLEYPQDSLFPYKVMDKTVFPEGLEGDESLVKSVSTPVELSEDLGKTLKQMDGDKERYYRTSHTARHDDLVFNPEATAEAFFKVIEDPDDRLDRLRQAAKNI